MDKPKSLGERCDEITAEIDDALEDYETNRLAAYGEICLEPMLVFKHDAAVDMEYLLAQKVDRGEMTDEDAADCMADFMEWLQAPAEQRAIIDPSQGLFDAEA